MFTPTEKQTQLLARISNSDTPYTTEIVDMRVARPLIDNNYLMLSKGILTLSFQANNFLLLAKGDNHKITAPYRIVSSINRASSRHIVLAGKESFTGSNDPEIVIRSNIKSQAEAEKLVSKLNEEMLCELSEIVGTYHSYYTDEPFDSDSVIIVRRTDAGRLGWSFNKATKADGTPLQRGDAVTLSDGKTVATVLFAFNNEQLIDMVKTYSV
jgi:hypothetical protein